MTRLSLTRLAPFVAYALSLVVLLGEAKAQAPCPPLRGFNQTICFGGSDGGAKVQLDPASIRSPNAIIYWRNQNGATLLHTLLPNERATELPMSAFIANLSVPPGSGNKALFDSNPNGQVHVINVTQEVPGAGGCSTSQTAKIYIIQQPQLTQGLRPAGPDLRICNGLSITLNIPAENPDVSLTEANIPVSAGNNAPVRFSIEFSWAETQGVTFTGTVPFGLPRRYTSPSAFASVGFPTVPPTGLRLDFSYTRQYRILPIEGFSISSKACASPASPILQRDVFPRPAEVGSVRASLSEVCTGHSVTLEINRPPSGVRVLRWERTFESSTVQLPAAPPPLSHKLESSFARGTAPGAYLFSAVLQAAGGANNCIMLTPPATVNVHQFDLNPLVAPNVCEGGPARFSSAVTNLGGNTPTFTWLVKTGERDFEPVAGGDGLHAFEVRDGRPELSLIAPVQRANGYQYKLKAANGSICEQLTPAATLRVGARPEITRTPSAEGCEGETLRVFAKGGRTTDANGQPASEVIKYQWLWTPAPVADGVNLNSLTPNDFIALGDERTSVSTQENELVLPYSSENRNKAVRVKITSEGNCSAYSAPFRLTYSRRRVVLTEDLQDREVCRGLSGSFRVTTESPMPSDAVYKWRRGSSASDPGTLIPGETGSTYRLTYADTDHHVYFWVTIENGGCPIVSSQKAKVTVRPGPVLGTVTADRPCNGQAAKFTMTGASSGPGGGELRYEWEEINPGLPDGHPDKIRRITPEESNNTATGIAAPNTPFALELPAPRNGFGYRAALINNLGSSNECRTESPPALFRAAASPLRLQNIQAVSPSTLTVCAGGLVTLSIDRVPGTGIGELTYIWRRTGAAAPGDPPIPPIPEGTHVTSRTLTVNNLQLEGARTTKTYAVKVKDESLCEAESLETLITVTPPGGDFIHFEPDPSGTPRFCPNERMRFRAYYSNGNGLCQREVWQEARAGSGDDFRELRRFALPVGVSIENGTERNPSSPYYGLCYSILSLPAAIDASATPPVTRQGYKYKIIVTHPGGGCPAERVITANIHPDLRAVITPSSQEICEAVRGAASWTGGNANFRVTPSPPNANYVYQWRRNEAIIGDSFYTPPFTRSGTQSPELVIRTAGEAQGGRYSVQVINPTTGCRVTSAPATLTVHARPPVSSYYYKKKSEDRVTYPVPPSPVDLHEPIDISCTSEAVMGMVFLDRRGIDFQWEKSTRWHLIDPLPFLPVTNNPTATTPELKVAVPDYNNLSVYQLAEYRYYRLKMTYGPGCTSYYPHIGPDRYRVFRDRPLFYVFGKTRSLVTWRPWNYPYPHQPPFTDPLPPIHVEDNCEGKNAKLSVHPAVKQGDESDATINYSSYYQWIKKDRLDIPDDRATPVGEAIPGRQEAVIRWPRQQTTSEIFRPNRYEQTPKTLTINNLQEADAGFYSIRVRWWSGYEGFFENCVLREAPWVHLRVHKSPVVSVAPHSDRFCANHDAEFRITAPGAVLRWQEASADNPSDFHDIPLENATADKSRLVLPAAYIANKNGWKYRVRVRNPEGPLAPCDLYSPSEEGVTLTVDEAPSRPVITAMPVCSGDNAEFTITGLPMPRPTPDPYSYQWLKEGLPIEGAVSSSLRLLNVPAEDDQKTYAVTINTGGRCASLPSSAVRLRVHSRPGPIAPLTAVPGSREICLDQSASFTTDLPEPSRTILAWKKWRAAAGDRPAGL